MGITYVKYTMPTTPGNRTNFQPSASDFQTKVTVCCKKWSPAVAHHHYTYNVKDLIGPGTLSPFKPDEGEVAHSNLFAFSLCCQELFDVMPFLVSFALLLTIMAFMCSKKPTRLHTLTLRLHES